MTNAVVVGHGLAGRYFHCPLIRRQPGLNLLGVVARDPVARDAATAFWGVRGYASLNDALADPEVELIVVATPHDTHVDLAVRSLEAGRHCVVDKVMALSEADADRMIAARDASDRMLSVFHNRRWDWDFLTVQSVLEKGDLGRPLLVESGVCRYSPPRTWRGRSSAAGTILHDWGAHLVDQALRLKFGRCLRLSAWTIPAPWSGVDSGGHGRISMQFENGTIVEIETSRICPVERPRWSILGTSGALRKFGVDPQEDALRRDNLDSAIEPSAHRVQVTQNGDAKTAWLDVDPVRGSWDSYYANIADHLAGRAALAVSAEEAREVVRVLDAAELAIRERRVVEGPWGTESGDHGP
jgi:scyllo-inositol 2-dehydrogenase (NADP+)